MINIRSDEDASPEDVLEAMTPEQAAQVPFLQHPCSSESHMALPPLCRCAPHDCVGHVCALFHTSMLHRDSPALECILKHWLYRYRKFPSSSAQSVTHTADAVALHVAGFDNEGEWADI